MKVKVLHIGKFYHPHVGGIETFTRDLLRASVGCGVDTLALVHAHGEIRAGKETDGRVAVWRAPTFGSLLYAPVSPAFPLWLSRAIEKFRPDLLHIHMPNTSGFWPLFLPAARRLPWVIHWHADVLTHATRAKLALAYRCYAPFERALLQHAHAIIATSPPYLASSVPLRPFRDKCAIIPLGLDFPPKEELPAHLDDPLWEAARLKVLAIGRLSHYKGFCHLVAAAHGLPGARIVIVGEGEERTRLERQIAAERLGRKVALPGRLPAERLQTLLAGCDVFCLPSVERTEAFGVVLMEAMRFAKPLVASRLSDSGMSWVVEDGVTGRLATPGDPQAISRAVQEAAVHPEWGVAGRHRLEQRFAIADVATEITALYRRCCPAGD